MSNTRSYRCHRLQLEQELAESVRRAERNQIEREVALRERTAAGIAPIAPAALMALFAADTGAAWGALAALSREQLVVQAIEVACWLEGQGRRVGWGDILRRWEARLAEVAAAPGPAPAPADVAAACLAIAEEARDAAAGHTAQGNGDAASDLAAAARAATKAAFYAAEGDRVARWVGEALIVRSATQGGAVYAVTRAGCPCEAGARGRPCWHAALRQGHERAGELWEVEQAARDVAA